MSESTTREKAEAPFRPFTRKYLGSKRLLREWIADRICAVAGTPRVFLDGFFGTGAVGFAMARRGAQRIVAVDTLRSNCAILRGFTASSPRVPDADGPAERAAPRARLRDGKLRGHLFHGGELHAHGCRARGDRAPAPGGRISAAEHDILLASFLLSADRVANTLGQYDAFLKNIGGDSIVEGRHMVDERVRTPFFLRPLETLPRASIEVIEDDMIAAAPRLAVDVAYYDPPYNGRQYCDNYHVLENLARWEKPPLFGKTRKFDRTGLRSPFSRRSDAADALRRLAAETRGPAHVSLLQLGRNSFTGGDPGHSLGARRGECHGDPLSRFRQRGRRVVAAQRHRISVPHRRRAGAGRVTGSKKEMLDENGRSRGFYSENNRVNDLTGREWVFWTRSVITKPYPPNLQHALRSRHGGQKPPDLCADLLRVFTKEGQSVLDPFMGVGGVLLGASLCGRTAVGVDLNPEWIEIYREVCQREGIAVQETIQADARDALEGMAERRFDCILTDVPYWKMDSAGRSRGTFKRVGEKARPARASKLSAFHRAPVCVQGGVAFGDGGRVRPRGGAPADRGATC